MPGIVCHVLLCETNDGLALVDTGLGTFDYADPSRMGPVRHLLRPEMNEANSAIRQVEARGFGVDEYAAAVSDPDFLDRRRYRPQQWAHNREIRIHEGRGDDWKFGLTAHGIDELPGIAMIPMRGHSRGHAAVAVDAGDRGLLVHAGDAVFDGSFVCETSPAGRPLAKIGTVRAFEKVIGRDRKAIKANHATLARLQREDGVTVIPAHDKRIFDDLLNTATRDDPGHCRLN